MDEGDEVLSASDNNNEKLSKSDGELILNDEKETDTKNI